MAKRQKKTKIEKQYVKVSENAKPEKFHQIGERVRLGELRWSYYGIDSVSGNVGYHYYLILI